MLTTCERIEDLIAVRNSGSVPADLDAQIETHLAACPTCRAVAGTAISDGASRSARFTQPVTALPAVSPSAYALGREIARGGMGRILEARDLRVGRQVAVKELLARDSAALAARFEREARVTARLQHPGIVPIYEIGAWPDGTPFYSMRLIEGTTLAAAVAAAPSLEARLALLPAVITATEAIAFAHARRVIHRDLTPANVMLGAFGETVVIDWGLAKDLAADDTGDDDVDIGPYRETAAPAAEGLTFAGAVIGTAAYMPPEQAAGEVVDERGDVYALGALLYQLLAGAAPYRGATTAEILGALRSGPPEPIDTSGAPRDLVSIVAKAMAREPGDRYANAAELAAELRRFQTGRIVEAHAYSRRDLVRRWVRRHRALVIGIAAISVALGITLAISIHAIMGERDRADEERATAIAARDTAASASQRASTSATALLEEQGRQYLLAGDGERALAYLDAAMQQGADSPALRLMIGTALEPMTARLPSLPCPGGPAQLAASHDRSLLAAHCGDTLRVFALPGGAPVADVPWARSSAASSVPPVFSADDRFVVIGGFAPRVIDAHTGKVVRAIDTAKDQLVEPLATFADERFAVLRFDAVGFGDFAHPDTPLAWAPLEGTVFGGTGATFAAGATALAVSGGGGTFVFDAHTGKRTHLVAHAHEIGESLVFPADETKLLIVEGARVELFDLAGGRAPRRFEPASPNSAILAFQIDRARARLLVLVAGGDVELWSIADGQRLAHVATAADASDIDFIEQLGAAVVQRAERVEVRALSTGQVLAAYPSRVGLGVQPIADWIPVPEADAIGRIRIAPHATVFTAPDGEVLAGASGDGARAFTMTAASDANAVWDVAANKRLFHGTPPAVAAPDDRHLISNTPGDEVVIVDTRDGTTVPLVHEPGVRWVGCDASCTRAFTSDGKVTHVYDVATKRAIATLPGGAMFLDRQGQHVAISPAGFGYTRSGPLLITTTFALVDVATGKTLATTPVGHPVGFDATGTTFTVLEETNRLAVTETRTGVRLLEANASAVAIDWTGTRLTGAQNGHVETWTLPDLRDHAAADITSSTDLGHPEASADAAFMLDDDEAGALVVRDFASARELVRIGDLHGAAMRSTLTEQANLWFPAYLRSHWGTGDRIVYLGERSATVWTSPIDRRPASAIHADVTARVPWRVEGGTLVPITHAIRGRVVRGGEPVAGARVVAKGTTMHRWLVASTGADGTFAFDHLLDGEFELRLDLYDGIAPLVTVRSGGRDVTIDVPVAVERALDPYTAAFEGPHVEANEALAETSIFFDNSLDARALEYLEIDATGTRGPTSALPPGAASLVRTWAGRRYVVSDATTHAPIGTLVLARQPVRVTFK